MSNNVHQKTILKYGFSFSIIISIVFCLFFLAWDVNAFEIRQTIVDTNIDTDNDGAYNGMKQSFISPYSGYPTSINVPVKMLSSKCTNFSVSLQKEGVNSPWSTLDLGLDIDDSPPNILEQVFYWSTTSQPWALEAGETYLLNFSHRCWYNSNWRYYRYYGASTDVFELGVFGTSTQSYDAPVPDVLDIKDIMFIFNMSATSSFVEFSSTPTSTCQLQGFSVDVNLSDEDQADIDEFSLIVGLNADWSFPDDYFIYIGNTGYGVGNLKYDENTYFVVNPWSFETSSVYYARAMLCRGKSIEECEPRSTNTNIEYYSDQWEFVVDAFGTCTSTYSTQTEHNPNPYQNYSEFDRAYEEANAICDDINILAKPFCEALKFMFLPKKTSLDMFFSLKDDLAEKPPFGYVGAYIDTMDNFNTSTATSTVNYAWIENITIFDRIRGIFVWIFYIIFGIWVIKRFAHFSFQG